MKLFRVERGVKDGVIGEKKEVRVVFIEILHNDRLIFFPMITPIQNT
jgi:hypothetical protein